MTYRLVDSPAGTVAAKHGFVYAIQINKDKYGWHTMPGRDSWRSVMTACQDRLGKQYKIKSQRPGKDRKWFVEERATFTRFYFRTEAARFLVMLDMQ